MGRKNACGIVNNFKVAKKFWRYMKKHDQLLETIAELRILYRDSFTPTLSDPVEKSVIFKHILWCFRSKHMKVIEWKPASDRQSIVYRKVRKRKTVSLDQSFVIRREEKRKEMQDSQLKQEKPRETVDGFAELKKKLVGQSYRLQLTKDKNGISIQPNADRDGLVYMESEILLTVTNHEDTEITFQCSILGVPGPFQVDDLIHKIASEAKPVELAGDSRVDFTVALAGSLNPGVYSMPVAFMFYRDDRIPFHIVKYIRAEVVDPIVTSLQPKIPYVRPKPVAIVDEPYVATEPGQPPLMGKASNAKRLKSYDIPTNLRYQMNMGQLQAVFQTFEDGGIYTSASYCHKFSKLLHVEELQMEVDIQKYRMEKAKLKMPKAKTVQDFLTLDVPGLAEKRPSLVRGDRLFVRKLGADGTAEKKRYEGFVHQVELNKVYLKFSKKFHENYIENSSYQVDFKFNRTSLRMMHRAIQNAVPFLQLLPAKGSSCHVNDHVELPTPVIDKCFDRKIERNVEQKQAVENILAGTSKPYPYLVFGPPGTGKTVTIVEAINQVLKKCRNSRVLACAPSNSAADLVLERVAERQIVPPAQMVRLNAFGRCVSSVNKKVRKFCIQDREGFFCLPPKRDIESKYRFVVTTLITAGKLVSLGIPKSHFTHIFIDEAGQGLEPECLVPIVGLLGTEDDNAGQLVLAGDPKQLGPVLRSPVAIKYGLGISFLERLMGPNFRCFNRQPPNSQYDPKFVTKLLNNYRSHPAIIKLPNEMFYDNELRVCADEAQRNALCNWDGLKKQGFPVIFEAVCGKDQREEKSPSFFNPEEVSVVLRYVKELKEAKGVPLKMNEIGIISPYHRQVQKIRQELQKKPVNIQNIKVGSVEEFQGQERKVVIISTVRSTDEFLKLDAKHKLGFLRNPKRFNVAITRAKALLIVIGNPDVLCHDKHWRKFIQYCISQGTFSNGPGSGPSDKHFQMPEDADLTLAQKLAELGINESSLFEDEADLTGADYENRPWRSDEQ